MRKGRVSVWSCIASERARVAKACRYLCESVYSGCWNRKG